MVDLFYDAREVFGKWSLKGKGVVVLEEELDGEVGGMIAREDRARPAFVHDEVEEFGYGGLRNEGDGFAEGGVFGWAREEVAASEERGVQVLIILQLGFDMRVPSGYCGESSKVTMLELFHNVRRYSNSLGNAEGRATIVATMPDPFSHVAVRILW